MAGSSRTVPRRGASRQTGVAVVLSGAFPGRLISMLLYLAISGCESSPRHSSSPPPMNPEMAVSGEPAPVSVMHAAGNPLPETGRSAAFYRFTDEKGVVHLLDDYDKIPARYRSRVFTHRGEAAGGDTTGILIEGNQVFVPVTLTNGNRTIQANLLLDTGATVTTITEELAELLDLLNESTVAGKTIVADGRTIGTRLALLDAIDVGPKKKRALLVNIMPRSEARGMDDGLLGMDFLREFNYQLDFAGGVILWR